MSLRLSPWSVLVPPRPRLRGWLVAAWTLLTASRALGAGAEATALVAAMKLSDQLNYTWSRSIAVAGRVSDVDGRMTKRGFALVTMPMGPYLRMRLMQGKSDAAEEPELVMVFKGPDQCVVKTPQGWLLPAEVNALPVSRRGFGRGADGPISFVITFPHEEVAILVANYTKLQAAADGSVEGVLSETGAKLLLMPSGPSNVTVRYAVGQFRLWMQNGRLTKYEIALRGNVARVGDAAKDERGITQVITTSLKDIGTTTVDVPEEARRRLER